ncbi:MAG TPA: amine oxidase, partial [Clostridiales bacterium]|nr:amine oxidase [Clostridiales bacterium]
MSVQNAFYNPTNEQRHAFLKEALINAGRTEDYENIIELLGPGPDILELAPADSLKNYKIGIIGAGLAGLSAAYELRKLGASITVYDAEDKRIGGRIYTHYFNKSTEYFSELGATRIPISHETSWHYINLFNLDTNSMISPDSNNFLYTNNIRIRRSFSGKEIEEFLYPLYDLTEKERNTPWSELVSYADNTMLNNLTPVQRSEILKILPLYSDQYAQLTKMSTNNVYESLGLSQGFVNLLCAVNPIAAVLLNLSYNETMSGIYSLDFFSIYRISEGMVKLPLAFISSLINNNPPELRNQALGKVIIKFGHAVDGIFFSSDNFINLQYTDPKGTKASESFDLV